MNAVTLLRQGARGPRTKPRAVAPTIIRTPAATVAAAVELRRSEALAAAYVDTAPSRRWSHGQDLAPAVGPRMPTSVASGVLALRRLDCIGDSEVEAARRFGEDYIRGVLGVREPSLALRSGSADAHDVAIGRAAAVTRHRAIADVIGPAMTSWLVSFVVMDLSFVAMSDRYWPGERGRKEMRGGMRTLLVLLSRLYAAGDRRRR